MNHQFLGQVGNHLLQHDSYWYLQKAKLEHCVDYFQLRSISVVCERNTIMQDRSNLSILTPPRV